ncbi:hypothetical protein [Nonomuraea longicatena]|uniref:Neutral/alkaline non-lysosomal ceramidase N-terminal domain-containing protein n=1 Tax=Nonomuraea longicatena TaxID=83682 RepID=A0ABN1PWN8_9ACTN
MKVGYGHADLPVPEGTELGGYIDRPGPSAGTLDPLQVAVVTWFDGERRFALATADLICVNADLAERVRASVDDAEVWLAASHTHAGPETGCVPGGGATPAAWTERVSGAVRAAVRRAVDGERSSDGTLHRGTLTGVGADRSRPEASPSVPLDVVAVWDDSGLAGVVVVLPVHPTVLPASNVLVSADLVGAVREALRARLGAGTWVVVATGAAGDISTRFTRRGQDARELTRLADLVASRCATLLTRPGEPAWSDSWDDRASVRTGGRVTFARARRELARAVPAADADALAADYERVKDDPVAARLALSRLHGVRARPTETPSEATITAEVGVARIGALGVVGLPGEPFLGVAEAVQEGQGPVVVLGYVNGYPGYLPTAQAYARAEYEVLASAVAPGSAERLVETARHLLEET